MLFEFNRKKRRKPEAQPLVAEPELDQTQTPVIGFSTEDDDIHGTELGEYVRKNAVEESEVWRKIKRGELVARTENGFVYVYGNHVPQPGFPSYFEVEEPAHGESVAKMLESTGLPALSEQDHSNHAIVPQLALLVDQLAKAKEDHKQLLAFTEEAMNRVTRMCETAISTKERMLSEKDVLIKTQSDQIELLNATLREERQRVAKVRQDMEDLQMLTQAMISEK